MKAAPTSRVVATQSKSHVKISLLRERTPRPKPATPPAAKADEKNDSATLMRPLWYCPASKPTKLSVLKQLLSPRAYKEVHDRLSSSGGQLYGGAYVAVFFVHVNKVKELESVLDRIIAATEAYYRNEIVPALSQATPPVSPYSLFSSAATTVTKRSSKICGEKMKDARLLILVHLGDLGEDAVFADSAQVELNQYCARLPRKARKLLLGMKVMSVGGSTLELLSPELTKKAAQATTASDVSSSEKPAVSPSGMDLDAFATIHKIMTQREDAMRHSIATGFFKHARQQAATQRAALKELTESMTAKMDGIAAAIQSRSADTLPENANRDAAMAELIEKVEEVHQKVKEVAWTTITMTGTPLPGEEPPTLARISKLLSLVLEGEHGLIKQKADANPPATVEAIMAAIVEMAGEQRSVVLDCIEDSVLRAVTEGVKATQGGAGLAVAPSDMVHRHYCDAELAKDAEDAHRFLESRRQFLHRNARRTWAGLENVTEKDSRSEANKPIAQWIEELFREYAVYGSARASSASPSVPPSQLLLALERMLQNYTKAFNHILRASVRQEVVRAMQSNEHLEPQVQKDFKEK